MRPEPTRPVDGALARRFRARVLLVLSLASVAMAATVAAASGAPPAAASEPTIAVETVDLVGQGSVTRLRLADWPPGTVTVALCGDEGRRASVDCDQAGARSAGVDATGDALVLPPSGTPPIGCPCVFRVSTAANDVVRTLPVEVPGVPLLPPDQMAPDPALASAADGLRVDADVTDVGGDRLHDAFGIAPTRTLVLEVRNGDSVTRGPFAITVSVGREARSGTPLPTVTMDAVAPGRARRVEIPIELDTPAVGDHVVAGTILGGPAPMRFEERTSHRPWGLLAVVGVLTVLLVMGARRALRQRRHSRLDVASGAMPGEQEVNPGEQPGEPAESAGSVLLDSAP